MPIVIQVVCRTAGIDLLSPLSHSFLPLRTLPLGLCCIGLHLFPMGDVKSSFPHLAGAHSVLSSPQMLRAQEKRIQCKVLLPREWLVLHRELSCHCSVGHSCWEL